MKKRMLLIGWFSKEISPPTVFEHLGYIRQFSEFDIDLYNTKDHLLTYKRYCYYSEKTKRIRLSQYDGLIIHNTQSYHPKNVYRLQKWFDIPIESYTGLKVLMKQDELVYTNQTRQLLKDWDFHLLFTCVPKRDIEVIYPKKDFPNLTKSHVSTGYVTEQMRQYRFSQNDQRDIDICYRGMKLPYHFGSLSYEKFQIGENFKKICADYDLVHDISSNRNKRIYGDAWIQFLANSKAALAVESGGSIYDLDGSIAKRTRSYLWRHWRADFNEVYDQVLKPYDGTYIYNALSPRHFEAAATKTILIMHEGEYGEIFKPWIHYIEVKKDYSNIDEVITAFKDKAFRMAISENAYNDIIQNPVYGYEQFVKSFDYEINKFIR